MLYTSPRLKQFLEQASPLTLAVYTALVSFCLYSCVYTFRKTFTVATFEGLQYLNVDYKVWLVVFQVMGYALSKMAGIKIISELKAADRGQGILLIVSASGICWLLFGLIPAPWNLICLFLNGLSLGLIWGVIFSYLEGRKITEILAAGLSVSFILSSGAAKTIGGFLLLSGISAFWMPFVTCLLFIVPLLIFLILLNHVPPPSAVDEVARTKRQPMNGAERKKFIRQFWPGMVLFIFSYVLLTAFRDFRDNFSTELWQALHYTGGPEIFTTAELPAVLLVLILVGSIMLIKNNAAAFLANHVLIFLGLVAVGVGCFLFRQQQLSPVGMMITVGTGLYLAYVPFNSIFFERMLATFQFSGTVGFVMYVSDSFGYVGSVAALFIKEFGMLNMNWLDFFLNGALIVSVAGSTLMACSAIYFALQYTRKRKTTSTNAHHLKSQPYYSA
jgi:MFS family permease